ncbi:hypothetical protein glysoja_030371 [Glycine soja]|uniref:Uncharacterized protein n=1 Tax=Glycine soja TaxID=3848 RepID=A0A0B2R3F8_GLYSO|nr:hypothetical protein glysoja_030371 [Glycine soja]
MPWYFPELKSNTRLCLTFRGRRLCSSFSNDSSVLSSPLLPTYLPSLGKGGYLEFYIAPAPAKMGYGAAVKRFLKVMAMVWAGSQITKLVRAGGALTLTPFVDRGLSWFTHKFKFQTREDHA